MNRLHEYAAEYSKRERDRFVLIGTTLGALSIAASQMWLFPWLKDFAANAHCRTVLGMPGRSALFYGIFGGLPLLAATMLAATIGRRGLKILSKRQVPPAGDKVLRPTVVRRGERARLIGHVHLLTVLGAVVLALWGFVQAGKLIESARSVPDNCAANESSKPTPLRGAAQLRYKATLDVPAAQLRFATAADREICWRIFRHTMRPYIEATWGWNEADQLARFEASFKSGGRHIIELGGQPIGMLHVDAADSPVRLLNIQLLSAFQRRGHGTAIIEAIIREAGNRPLWLQVLKVNPARSLYERLGFGVIGQTDTHWQMQRDPSA